MLKRIIILFVALLYINVSSGIGVQFHYCMGKLVSMAFGHSSDHEDACNNCGMDSNENSCCKDETFTFKVKDGHQPSSFLFSFNANKQPNFIDYSYYSFHPNNQQRIYDDLLNYHESNTSQRTSKLYVVLRVFRI